MKMWLRPFDEALELGMKIDPAVCSEYSICSFTKNDIPWGSFIDVTLGVDDEYNIGGYYIPDFCFDEGFIEDLLYYGDFLKSDFHYEFIKAKIRPVITRLILYKGNIYYYKVTDDTGEIMECEKVGKANEP